jgi:isopentenyl-diphosphate delta-isomerase
MNSNTVIAVNEKDEVLGYHGKMEVHEKGILHRAISVFIFNSSGEWLLQQRAQHKYHSAMLWSNTSCTHPMKGETILEAANRRLFEEMGMHAILTKKFSFQYRAQLSNELVEHELDHIFIGMSDDLPKINMDEVADYQYLSTRELSYKLKKYPDHYTEWFKLLFSKVLSEINK